MPIVGYEHSLFNGLSDFWQRFFADAKQLEALYKGDAILMGQSYLDMLSNVLAVSLKDVPAFNKEYFRLIVIREDGVVLEKGASTAADRWVFQLDADIVGFDSLDNKVWDPTASLEDTRDYTVADGYIRFKQDPTDPLHDGVPLDGYARRSLDVAVGGWLDDTDLATAGTTWQVVGARKGDVIRLLEIGTGGQQTKISDHLVVLVRARQLYVSSTTPLPAPYAANYVLLRRPADYQVLYEPHPELTGGPANLLHMRLDVGSVVVYAKAPGGGDVVEGVDYIVDYENGIITPLTSFLPASNFKVSYTWRQEVYPTVAGLPPRYSTFGEIQQDATARVLQIALWAPDARVDRRIMAANFGSFIGSDEASSEGYRAFLRGIFQLYWLGPVLERIESALNVILGFPVVRDDDEVLLGLDTSADTFNRVTMRRPNTSDVVSYDFPKDTPLITAVSDPANYGVLTFKAFDPLTTALTVTDYIQDPEWWHHVLIPRELFGATDPDIVTPLRRTANPLHVEHVVGAEDDPRVGDPGLYVGADDNGFQPPPGHAIFRHRVAFVMMDRVFKYHTFIVRFDPAVFTATGTRFARTVDDLNRLIFSAKPAHTYIFAQPGTTFFDEAIMAEEGYYQPQRYAGADPNAPEIYATIGDLPSGVAPYVLLGLFIQPIIGSPTDNPDTVLFADGPPVVEPDNWEVGDWFHYEEGSPATNFPVVSVAVALAGAPVAPRRGRLVRVFVDGLIGGLPLIENTDYTVDYAARTVTRLTAWDATASITVQYVQLTILNEADGAPDLTLGDSPLLVGSNDPSTVHADYDPLAVDWMGNLIPITNPRDISMVERALTIKIT